MAGPLQLRKQHPDLCVFLNGASIPVVDEAKFPGVIFDNKLSFTYRISGSLKTNVLKA